MKQVVLALSVASLLSAAPTLAQPLTENDIKYGATELKHDGQGGLYLPKRIQGDIAVVSSTGEFLGYAPGAGKHIVAGTKFTVITPGKETKRREVLVKDLQIHNATTIKLPMSKSQFMALK